MRHKQFGHNMTLFGERMKSNSLPESLSQHYVLVLRKLAAGGVWAPSSRRPGGLNAHCSGGQILFFVSLLGEHLHDGVTPRPTEKPSARLPQLSFAFVIRGAEPNMSPKSSSRSPWARRGSATWPSIVRSRIAFVAGGRELCPRGGGGGSRAARRRCFLGLPADLNWDKVELLSWVCGAERRPVCSRVLHYTTSDKKKKNPKWTAVQAPPFKT